MKISKRQLRQLIREMNPDGTISDNEDEEREGLMAHIELTLNELLDHVISESDRIGGGFRGPGIKKQAIQLMTDMIGGYRK